MDDMKKSKHTIDEISAEWEVLEQHATELVKNSRKTFTKVWRSIHQRSCYCYETTKKLMRGVVSK